MGSPESDITELLSTGMQVNGLPCGSAGEEPACRAGDAGSIPGSGRSAGEGIGYPLQYSDLENSMDCAVHGVTKSDFNLLITQFNEIKQKFANKSIKMSSNFVDGFISTYFFFNS